MEGSIIEKTTLPIFTRLTLILAFLTFLATISNWFKRAIPLQFGFLLDEKMVDRLEVSTGDLARPIFLRFHNLGRMTLTGIELDIRFHKPIALSASDKALTIIPDKTIHGRVPDGSYYLIRFSDLVIFGNDKFDVRVELNTQNQAPGTNKISVTAYLTQQTYKYKKAALDLVMR